MEERNCWDKFAVSGKVEDYLEYRSTVGYVTHNKSDTADMGDNVERSSDTYWNGSCFITS